jgi:3,4-dihydroxy 2-butanone 4-phosphate synthase/GTP cyclohydrolase II
VVSAYRDYLSSIDEIIADARAGRPFILVDDEDRENEGDLIIPGEFASAEMINFMVKHCRGLVCLALTRERVDQLGLKLMNADNRSRLQTAFTLSIEAREGVTTGISAADRAHTIATAIDPARGAADIVSPGHIFPLAARQGGVLVRAGHTEAAVDISRLAGLNPSGVICEIMNDDGTMARMPDLIAFAQAHGFKVSTVADLISYRRRTEHTVESRLEAPFHSKWGGDWQMRVYANTVDYAEHIALVKGRIDAETPAMVRVHAINVLDDVLGDQGSGKAGELHRAMELIGAHGCGVVVLVREPRPTSLSELVRAQLEGRPSVSELRDYGVGAQILLDLGVRRMILLSNTRRCIVGLDGYGLAVVEQRPIDAA